MTKVITDGTVYLGRNLFGEVSNIKAPDIEPNSLEIKTIGGVGTFSINLMSVKELKSSFTLTGFDAEVFKKVANPNEELTYTIYSDLKEYNGETLVSQKPYTLQLRGSCSKFPLLGEMKAQENTDFQLEFNNTAAKLTVDGAELYDIDVTNHVYKVNGVDLLAKTKANLGL